MKTTKHNPSVKLLFSDASGVYIPKRFATEIKRGAISGVKPEDLDYLALGPGGCLDESQDLAQGESVRGEYYWDIWETVIDQALITDEHGNEYKLHQDGDVWLVPRDWEYCEETGQFRPPESETLRLYVLPAYWACSIFNGDDSSLEDGEREQIDAFLAREGLDKDGWREADCGEPYFSHDNDATNLGGDVCEYTFVKIG